jgi:hypothetical protein
MPTTTNFGWTIPADTDLVKDGAAAIRTLGNAIDTTANTTFRSGLVKISSNSFSAVSSQVVSNCFSSTYLAYMVQIQITSHSAVDKTIYLKLRNNSTDTSDFYNSYIAAGTRSGTTSNLAQFDDTNGYKLGEIDGAQTGNNFACSMNIIGPFVDDRSQMNILTTFWDGAGNMRFGAGAGGRTAGTSHNSLNLIASTGTITGTIKVYGYAN